LLHRVYAAAALVLRSSPALHRVLFGCWPSALCRGQLWDWTSLQLKVAMRQHGRPGMSLLDMGTGPAGVLAIYAKKRLNFGMVCAADHLPQLLPSARYSAARCGAAVEFIESSLFANIHGRFDMIVFNAPYIGLQAGKRVGALCGDLQERRWSGGADGTTTIRRFLADAPRCLNSAGVILLGVNRFYVAPNRVLEACAAAGLDCVEELHHRLTLASVFVLRPRSAPRVLPRPSFFVRPEITLLHEDDL
jgi:methylase of polypeptide subunit release factors